jgi:hypothetical protein
VGERWLEAWYMVRLMIDSDYNIRTDAAKLLNHVFFKNEQERFNLIKKAQEILMKNNSH